MLNIVKHMYQVTDSIPQGTFYRGIRIQSGDGTEPWKKNGNVVMELTVWLGGKGSAPSQMALDFLIKFQSF